MKRYIKYLIIIIIIGAIASGTWFFAVFFEGEKPNITVSKQLAFIGRDTSFDVSFTDKKSGLKTAQVSLLQDGKTHIISSADFSQKGTFSTTLRANINSSKLKLKEGQATIEISTEDHSLRKNKTNLVLPVTVDTQTPQIFLMTSSNYINPGGSCVAVYGLSEDVVKTGINVDNTFYPAYSLDLNGKARYISYFPIPLIEQKQTVKIAILAQDQAGNVSLRSIPHQIRRKIYKHDTINISSHFLETKVPEFQQMSDDLNNLSLLEAFIAINDTMRTNNSKEIQSVCTETASSQLWDGPFLRMNNAATMATFGDKRTYYYQKKVIGTSRHLGIDLASIKNAPVIASNSGTVIFTGTLGIYGNTIIIDHGCGVHSLYSHLSLISVTNDQQVNKGDIIGNTGSTGLAGGDHLHFSIMVGGTFVDPAEWWDPHWIKDNIVEKIESCS